MSRPHTRDHTSKEPSPYCCLEEELRKLFNFKRRIGRTSRPLMSPGCSSTLCTRPTACKRSTNRWTEVQAQSWSIAVQELEEPERSWRCTSSGSTTSTPTSESSLSLPLSLS